MDPAIVIGIDKAGCGLLGPLVVSAVAFEVPADCLRGLRDPGDGPDLWKLLRLAVSRRPLKRGSRLAVADSKILYDSADRETGLKLLERAALAFLLQDRAMPTTLREILCELCPAICEELGIYPWYAPDDLRLPLQTPEPEVRTQCNALRVALQQAGIRFRGAWVEVVPEGHFNRMIEATRNKAVVLFTQTVRLIQRITADLDQRPLRIWGDRHGGRVGYRQSLMTAFDGVPLEVIDESPDHSAYRLRRRVSPFVIRFITKGESKHLPIALASIYSKYVRELFMTCFNRYWTAQQIDLKPTAGYYKDGQRFIADIEPLIARQRLDRRQLVRVLVARTGCPEHAKMSLSAASLSRVAELADTTRILWGNRTGSTPGSRRFPEVAFQRCPPGGLGT